MHSISERVRLYRLSHILIFRVAFLQSLSYHGVSGRSLTEMFSTGRCLSRIRRKVPSYKSKRVAGDIVESVSALSQQRLPECISVQALPKSDVLRSTTHREVNRGQAQRVRP